MLSVILSKNELYDVETNKLYAYYPRCLLDILTVAMRNVSIKKT